MVWGGDESLHCINNWGVATALWGLDHVTVTSPVREFAIFDLAPLWGFGYDSDEEKS